MEARYRVLKLWEAPDRDAFLAEHRDEVRAIATRGDLGASAGAHGARCRSSRSSPATALAPTPSTSPTRGPPASA